MFKTKFCIFPQFNQKLLFYHSVCNRNEIISMRYSSYGQKLSFFSSGQKFAAIESAVPSRVTDSLLKSFNWRCQPLKGSGLHNLSPLSPVCLNRTLFKKFPSEYKLFHSLVHTNTQNSNLHSFNRQNLRSNHSGQKFESVESAIPSEETKTTTLSEADIKDVVDHDPELEKVLKVLILEIDIFRQDGQLVPDHIENFQWRELLGLKNRSSRLRYLTFLFKNEKKENNQKSKKAAKAKERKESKKEVVESGHLFYGFGGSTIFLRVYDSTMDAYLNKNLMNAAMFSQHIVLDCSYDRHMTKMESKNCARQICMLFSENRNHPNPFHIQFCNADPDSHLMHCVNKYFPTMYEPQYPFFVSEKSYLDLYPKEQLVYLTPHCRHDLLEWNHDDVYIVGAMVDKSNPKPLSLAKAKEEGLRMAKLPLERHLIWGSGATKNLTLNQMTSILLDMRHTNDWNKAFKHIPRRKLVTDQELVNEARKENSHVFKKFVKKRQGVNEVLLSDNMIQKMKPKKFDVSSLYDNEK